MKNRIRKQNNKGFSLVELVVAVAILAVAAAPLLHSFVTAARMDHMGRQTNAATLAAQNIQEVLTASTLEKVLDGSCFQEQLGVVVQAQGSDDDVQRLLLKNVSVADESYDALVSLDKSKFERVNQSAVPVFSAMDAVFTQPNGETNNPDTLAYESFSAYGSDSGVSRTITLDITKNESGDKAFATVDYTYTSPFYTDIKQEFVFNILPNGYPLADGKVMNLFLMYYPWTKGSTEKIIINNTSDVPVNLYLVNQDPTYTNQQLEVEQYQSKDYERDHPTAFLFCNSCDALTKYRVFLGSRFISYDNKSAVSENLVSSSSQARLYGVQISLFEPNAAIDPVNPTGALYTLSASRFG